MSKKTITSHQKGFTLHNFFCKKSGGGFTLVELLVVISIIGILSSLSAVSVNIARERARDAKRKADAAQIQLALYLYYDDNLHFPEADMLLENAVDPNWAILTRHLDGTETGRLYMKRVPLDSLNIFPHEYGYNSDGKEFIIQYYLEDGGPKDVHGY